MHYDAETNTARLDLKNMYSIAVVGLPLLQI